MARSGQLRALPKREVKKNERGPGRSGGPYVTLVSRGTDVLRLGTLRALSHLELNALVLLQRLVSRHLDRREVHEDVVSATLLRDEAETLLGVEPLDNALSHARCTPVVGAWNHHCGDASAGCVTLSPSE